MLPQWITGGAGGVGAPSTAAAALVAADLGHAITVGGCVGAVGLGVDGPGNPHRCLCAATYRG
jgi:hypothetical protein